MPGIEGTVPPSSASSSAPEEHNEDGSESWRTMVVRMLDALSSLTLPTLLSRRTADAGSAVTPARDLAGEDGAPGVAAAAAAAATIAGGTGGATDAG